MARSNQGGTRGFIRGKVGTELYQVTKNVDGKKIQLVRAVEESRTNNNTILQALARMRMALLMGALKDLKEIVDHSWEGISYGQLSIANFVRVNMPAVIYDCQNNWTADNQFCYPVKGMSDMRIGRFYISSGSLITPENIIAGGGYLFGEWFPFKISIPINDRTFGGLRRSLGFNADDYITLLILSGLDLGSGGIINQKLFFLRLYIANDIPDDTLLFDIDPNRLFTFEGNTLYQIQYDDFTGSLSIQLSCRPDGLEREVILQSIIVSHWTGSIWARNNAQFNGLGYGGSVNFEYNSPRVVFKSWFPEYNPEDDNSISYPVQS